MNRECLLLLSTLLLPGVRPAAQTLHDIRLTARPQPIEIEPGKTVHNGWLYNGVLPGPTLRVTEGDVLRVTLRNELDEPTTIHWHGLPIPLRADGVPGVTQGPIGIGQRYVYQFQVTTPGTYWYHPHFDMQIDRGLVGALIVEPRNKTDDPPFNREHVVLLDDWLPGDPPMFRDPSYSDYLLNGRTSKGQTPFPVKKGEVVRFRVLNVSGFTSYVFTLDGHPMRVSHADGQPVDFVETRAIPIGAGERWDIYVTADKDPTTGPGKWSLAVARLDDRTRTVVRGVVAYEGATDPDPSPDYVPFDLRSAPLLTYAALRSRKPRGGISPVPDVTHDLWLDGNMMQYVWTINGQAFPNADPIVVRAGKNVRFQILNRSMHEHPMHLHGHFMKLLGTAGGTTAPLVKDTVLLPPGTMMRPSRIDTEFVADNPGNWPLHCHIVYHMHAGMMRLVHYQGTDQDGDGLSDHEDFDPQGALPVTWTDGGTGAYLPGSTLDLIAQWPRQTAVLWVLGTDLVPPLDLGALGWLRVNPLVVLGAAAVGPDRQAILPLPLPNDPKLSGIEASLQAVGTHAVLPPGARLSTVSWLRVR